jgi:CHAT domain-containing protein
MMACVSGLAREGIGGDSLGLDWALIQSGATSLVSTHWAVSASCAAKFFDGFYARWVGEGLPRAEAFRRTLLGLMGRDRSPWSLSQWAAFSLTGDFR